MSSFSSSDNGELKGKPSMSMSILFDAELGQDD